MLNKIFQIALVALAFTVISNCGRKNQKPKGLENWLFFKYKKTDSMTVVTLNRTGPYTEVGKAIGEVMDWLKAKGITPSSDPFVFYYNDPKVTPPESCSWAVCVQVPPGTKPDQNAGILLQNLPPMGFLVTAQLVRLEDIPATYELILNWLTKEQKMVEIAGPAVEVYSIQEGIPPESIKAHIGFVVKPKEGITPEEKNPEEGGG